MKVCVMVYSLLRVRARDQTETLELREVPMTPETLLECVFASDHVYRQGFWGRLHCDLTMLINLVMLSISRTLGRLEYVQKAG